MKNRQQLENEIGDLCEQAGCSENIAKIHLDEYVNHQWHPHPSKQFEVWWHKHPDFRHGIDVKRAFNCQCYRQEFLMLVPIGYDSGGLLE